MDKIANHKIAKIQLSDEDIRMFTIASSEMQSYILCLQFAKDQKEREYWRNKYYVSNLMIIDITLEINQKYIRKEVLDNLLQVPIIDIVTSKLVVVYAENNEQEIKQQLH